ncbi:hypothetical protein SAMN05216571_101241 [Onishia taeanensis]|uniref:AAA domain-containing protein n=1 Tax=Onishia taeanensis TaxID=284577 RepID=A0A1G7N5S8_9GAMM|nr:hypothetical protein [Halomonas taeanensis]SDF69301.1 hypothetical protein SAMN05216571_101241 [Halomonas taeanensis]
MSVVIVYGEQGSGKSPLTESLTRLYRLANVVDEWDGKSPSVTDMGNLPGGCLVLTNAEVAVCQEHSTIYLHVEQAKALVAKVRSAA